MKGEEPNEADEILEIIFDDEEFDENADAGLIPTTDEMAAITPDDQDTEELPAITPP